MPNISKKLLDKLYPLIGSYKNNSKTKSSILKKIDNIITSDNPKPRTITVRYSIVKKLFNEYIDDPYFISQIRPSTKLTEKIIKLNEKTRDSRKVITINEVLINKIMNLRNSLNVYDVAIFLLFISGRRTSELDNFKFINVVGNKNIKMKGILKRKDIDECYFIPIINKTKFFKYYKIFKDLKNKNNIHSFQKNLIARSNKLFNHSPHFFRGAYATYMFTFRNTEKKKVNPFYMSILCHKSVDASLSYTQYKISFSDDIIKSMKV